MPFGFWRNFHIGLIISTSHPAPLGKLWSVREKQTNKSTPPVIKNREKFWAGKGKEADLFCPSCGNSLGETENMRYRIKTSQAKSGQVSFQTFDTRILVKNPCRPSFKTHFSFYSGKWEHLCTPFHSLSYMNAQKYVIQRSFSAAGMKGLLGVWLHSSALPSH